MNDFLYVFVARLALLAWEIPTTTSAQRSTAHYPSIYSVLRMANEAD